VNNRESSDPEKGKDDFFLSAGFLPEPNGITYFIPELSTAGC